MRGLRKARNYAAHVHSMYDGGPVNDAKFEPRGFAECIVSEAVPRATCRIP
jgi:hypothetical protein